MAKFCSNCGSPLQEGVRFCSNCGSPVSAPVQPAPVPQSSQQPIQEEAPTVVIPEEPTVSIWNDIMSDTPAPTVPEEKPTEGIWNDIMSDNPAPNIPVQEPAPVVSEPAAAFGEPIPVAAEPAPVVSEPAPVYHDPTPVYTDPAPVFTNPAPVYNDPTPVYRDTAPVYNTAPSYPSPSKPKAKAHKVRKPRGVGRTLLAILLCFIMSIFSFTAIALDGVHGFISEDTLETAVDEIVTELDEIPAVGLYTNIELDEDATIVDEFIAVSEHMGIPMSKKDIQTFMDESELVRAVMDSTVGSMSDMLQGKSDSGLDKEDILDLLYEDRELIEELSGEPIDDELIQSIADTVEDYGILELTDTKTLKDDMGGVFSIIELVMSPTMVVVLWAVVALFVVLLFLTNRFRIGQTCSDSGIVLVVTGGLNLIFAYLGLDLILSLLSDIPGADLLTILASSFAESWMTPSTTVLIIGAVLILVGIVIHLITKPKKHA